MFDLKTAALLALSVIVPVPLMRFVENQTVKTALLYSYGLVILSLTLLFRVPMEKTGINLQPLWSYKIRIWPQIIQNYLLFIPFGFLFPFAKKKRTFLKTILIGFCLSCAIEISQYLFQRGFCETDDIIGNTLGTAIGYGYWRLLSHLLKEK